MIPIIGKRADSGKGYCPRNTSAEIIDQQDFALELEKMDPMSAWRALMISDGPAWNVQEPVSL
jgi:hypothetical protein